MGSSPDFDSLNDQELAELVEELAKHEMDISYRRRVLHGEIDVARAELVYRRHKWHEGGDEAGGTGVREPRPPNPQLGAGGVSLPVTEASGDRPAGPQPPLTPDN
jgi:hypothetical protein